MHGRAGRGAGQLDGLGRHARAAVPGERRGQRAHLVREADARADHPGRTSGALRRTGLIYGEDGGNFVVVGSNGGSDRNPQWYLNLLADPRARIQVAADVHEVVAREAEGEERDRLWDAMVAIFPQYKSYRKKTERRIPVVVLEPRDS